MRKAKSARSSSALLSRHRFSFYGRSNATANASTHPLDADDATWAAVEATHGSLAACSLAHVQALAVASAAAAAKYRGAGDHRKTFKSL
jgi:hypothetical protein